MKKIICKFCQKEFFDFLGNHRVFCSKNCSYDYRKGKSPWNKGKKGSQIAWNKGISYHALEKHALWKGDKVGYVALHQWVRKQLGLPTFCSKDPTHKAKRYVWANISGDYLRDIRDWHSLCNSCNLKDGISTKVQFIDKKIRRDFTYA